MNKENFKEKFKIAWQNPRKKAAIKLGIYLLFIVVVCVLVVIGSSLGGSKIPIENLDKEPEILINYEEKIDKLSKNNFGYRYVIKNNDVLTATYTGVKLDNKTLGYKETSMETLRYYVDDVTYKVALGSLEVITNLYENIDINYIDANYIINLLKILTKTDKYNSENKLYYEYLNNNDVISVYFDENNITKMSIKNDIIDYDLEYYKIGEIKETDLSY